MLMENADRTDVPQQVVGLLADGDEYAVLVKVEGASEPTAASGSKLASVVLQLTCGRRAGALAARTTRATPRRRRGRW